jgi:hypothetical protein
MDDATEEPEEFPTTAEHFEMFIDEAKKWIGIFGLVGWRVIFCHEDLDSHAECWTKWNARIARLELSKSWAEDPKEELIRRSAFHEVCELLFDPLLMQASNCNLGTDQREIEMERARHSIIRTLENAVWEKEYMQNNTKLWRPPCNQVS